MQWILDPTCCSCQVQSRRTAGVLCFAGLSCKHTCGRLACFKKGLNGFATLAVCLELHAELGGEALETQLT